MATRDSQPNGAGEVFEFNLMQMASYFYSCRLWIFLGTTICVILALIWVTCIKRPSYRATAVINIDVFAEDKEGASALQSPFMQTDALVINKIGMVEQYFDSEGFKKFIYDTLRSGTYASLKRDVSIIEAQLDREGIHGHSDVTYWMHSKLEMKGSSEKSRIDMSAAHSQPVVAAAIANVAATALIEYNRLMLLQRLKTLESFLNAQTAQAKAQMHTLESELVTLQKSARILSPDDTRIKISSLEMEQESKLIEFNRTFAALNSLIGETETDLAYFKKLMQENNNASFMYIEQIQRRIEVLRYQRLEESGLRAEGRTVASDGADGNSKGGSRSGQTAALDQGIGEIAGELTKQLQSLGPVSQSPWEYVKKIEAALFELKQKRAQAKSDLAAQQESLNTTNTHYRNLPDVLQKMNEVKRNIDLGASLYTALMTRLQDTQIKQAAHANDLVMVSPAERPIAPAGLGKVKTVLLSVLGGFILSCLPFFLRFVLLPTIRGINDLRHLGVPIIGSIGWHKSGQRRMVPFGTQEVPPRILKDAPNSPVANALRFIRFRIEQACQLKGFRTQNASKLLLVSSVNPNEGRTFVAANLADLFATSGISTCLIDLDFANPGVGDFFPDAKREDSPMMDLFPKDCAFATYKINSKLAIIKPSHAVHKNMSEVLETVEFELALNALEVLYELIIVDTPPLTGHMEPVIAAQYADAFMLIVNQRRTLRTEVEEVINTLQSSLSLPIFGIVNFGFDEISGMRRKHKGASTKKGRAADNGEAAEQIAG